MKFTLAQVALWLGLGCLLIHLWPVLSPAACGRSLKKFPRNTALGVLFMLAGTGWFVWNLATTDISDFAEFRPLMLLGFVVIGVGSCFFVRDYLPVRGLAVLMLLAADLVLDVQRWHPSPLKNLVTVWMYGWIVLAMWVTVAPWRVRDWIAWLGVSETRVRLLGLGGLAWGGLITAMALTVYR
jgi:hypothetical protein